MEEKVSRTIVSRRVLLKTAAAAGAAMAFAACGQAATPTTAPKAAEPTKAPTTASKAAEPTKAPAVQPTAAPKAAQTEEIRVLMWTNAIRSEVSGLDHPWPAALKAFEAKRPDVKLKLINTVDQGQNRSPWETLALGLASGDPPEVQFVGGIAGALAPKGDIYLMVDLAPFFTKADLDDYGDALETVKFKPGKPDFIMGFPEGLYPTEFTMMANQDILDAAGFNWVKVQEDGWTRDEFIQLAQKVTDPAKERYGFGSVGGIGGYNWFLIRLALQDGMADNTNAFGNCWQWSGPIIASAAQFMQDMFQKYKVSTVAHLGLPSGTNWAQPLFEGNMAMTPNGSEYSLYYIDDYNKLVEQGKIAGKKVNTKVCILPAPRGPNGQNVNDLEADYVSVFKQDPYKGDNHTKASYDVAYALETTEVLVAGVKWRLRGMPGRKSAQKLVPPEHPQTKRMIAFWEKNAYKKHPAGHPIAGKAAQGRNALLEKVVQGQMSGEQYDAEQTKAADDLMKNWLATETDKNLIAVRAEKPSWFPGPKFPKWKWRTCS